MQPPSYGRINDDEEVLRGGDRRGSKKIAQDAVCICVCVPEERQNEFFPQHQRPPFSRLTVVEVEVRGGFFSFHVENRKKAKESLFCVCE